MSSNKLRKLIKDRLLSVCDKVYYRIAEDENLYPHITFEIRQIRKIDEPKDEAAIDIEIWTKSEAAANDMMDAVESVFNCRNDPQDDFLPTFFVEKITSVGDEDKSIIHKHIELSAQLYERQVYAPDINVGNKTELSAQLDERQG